MARDSIRNMQECFYNYDLFSLLAMCLFVLWDVISLSLPGIETSGVAAGSQGCTEVAFQMEADLLLMSLLW